jgi:hypothetical protein
MNSPRLPCALILDMEGLTIGTVSAYRLHAQQQDGIVLASNASGPPLPAI